MQTIDGNGPRPRIRLPSDYLGDDTMKRSLALWGVILALVMTACASSGPRMGDAERLAFYSAHAGEPVSGFRYGSGINSWTPLGDTALAVWTRPNEAFLLELFGRCPDLPFALSISVSHSVGRVSAGFDSVTPRVAGGRPGPIPCRIQTIRPLDTRALNESKRQLRAAVELVERAAEAGEPADE